jgi:hypothetical protein
VFARYMRGAVKKSKYFFTASKPYKSRLGNLQRVLLLGWRAKRPCCQRILGALPILTRALLRRQWFSIICSTGFGLLSLDCLPCSLDCGWRRWETPLLVRSRPWRVCCIGAGKASFGVSFALVRGTEAFSFIWRASFGVCGLLAMPNIHQIFGDNPVKFPRFTRDKAWVFSS